MSARVCLAALATFVLALAYMLRPLHLPASDVPTLEFIDRRGLPLGTILSRDGQHTAFVPLERIAPSFVAAVLAAEDDRFYLHGPVDAAAALRAVLHAVYLQRTPSGASTISMQLARLAFPVPRGVRGKLAEVMLATRLEGTVPKRDILEAYCNRIPMGGNLYGVEAAALTYFGVHAADLDVAQSALLAAIPNAPTRLDPHAHWQELRKRQRFVLERMVATDRLSSTDARAAADETLVLQPRGTGIVAAAHLLFAESGRVPRGVTVVRTTIDRPLQRFVETQVGEVVAGLAQHDVHDAAALVLDNRSGDVLAYAGSPDYFSDVALGRNDGVRALRQPGSALKPFLYELALERRIIRPTTILRDEPVAYAIQNGQLYQPVDYTGRFMGPVRVRIALANSLNVPAVRVLERVGVAAFLQRLRELGFAHLTGSAGFYGLGLTLGGGEVTLEELTRAYATLARGGNRVALRTLLDTPRDAAMLPVEVASPNAAWSLVTDMLADPQARAAAFGVDSVLALPFPAAVKTGTSSDFRDTWTIGFTRDYTVGVWVGNFDGTPMREISGVTGAAPLWNRIMLHLHEHAEPRAFDSPRGYRRRAICGRTGLRATPDCASIAMEWLDHADELAYARVPRREAREALVAITSPHDGDAFALMPGDREQRIDIGIATPDERPASVAVDGRRARRVGAAYTWPLRLGAHVVTARRGGDVARVHFTVERPRVAAREGFTDVASDATKASGRPAETLPAR